LMFEEEAFFLTVLNCPEKKKELFLMMILMFPF